MHAYVDYDGSVIIDDVEQHVDLDLNDQYRGQYYPVEEFNNHLTIVFPFGRYYLEKNMNAEACQIYGEVIDIITKPDSNKLCEKVGLELAKVYPVVFLELYTKINPHR